MLDEDVLDAELLRHVRHRAGGRQRGETKGGGVPTCGLNAASIPRTIFSASRPGCGVSRVM